MRPLLYVLLMALAAYLRAMLALFLLQDRMLLPVTPHAPHPPTVTTLAETKLPLAKVFMRDRYRVVIVEYRDTATVFSACCGRRSATRRGCRGRNWQSRDV